MPVDRKTAYHIEPYHMNGLNWRLSPDDPGGDNIVVVTGFMPGWWTSEYGITFGKEFHQDGDVHRETLARMESILRERFSDLPNFIRDNDYANSYSLERRYGDAFMPAIFGAEVSFDDASGHPYAPSINLPDEEVRDLKVPDIENNPVFNLLLQEWLGSYGTTTGELGFEGVINIAYKLRGEEIFLDVTLKPELAHHLFEVIHETIDKVVHRVREWQDPTGERPSFFVNCNCLMNMMSGEMYRQQLFDYDRRFSESFDIFGIHTCNWSVDPYLDALAEIKDIDYLDMGPDTDLDKVHKLFPELRPSVFLHPEKFRSLSVSEIKREITELGKRIGRGYILLSDLETGTTDNQIRAAYDATARL